MVLRNYRKWSSSITLPSLHPHSLPPFSPPNSPPPANNYSHTFTGFFEILNINPTYNKREVTVAFKTLARIYCPDKYYENVKEFTREDGEEKFKKLSNEYEAFKKKFKYFILMKQNFEWHCSIFYF